MMSEVTLKSTKQQIMDAYLNAKQENERLKRMTSNPVTDAAEKAKNDMMATAEIAVKEEIFNPIIVEKYNCVINTIKAKEDELKELYGIEAKAGELANFITTCAQKEAELSDSYRQKEETLKSEFNTNKEAYQMELDEISARRDKVISEARQEYELEKKAIERQRKRDIEEYTYNLERSRKKENDKWEDLKTKREKELADKEQAANLMLKEAKENQEAWNRCQDRVNEIPELIAAAKAEGIKEGKEKAEKSNAFEIRYLKKEYESRIEVLEATLTASKNAKADLEKENIKLSAKLDEAYARINDLAVKTAEATRTKYVTSEQTAK